jgi:hypothetical protein
MFPRKNFKIVGSVYMDDTSNDQSFLIPSDDEKSRNFEDKDLFANTLFPFKAFSGNLLSLLPKMEIDNEMVRTRTEPMKKMEFSKPKNNPFGFRKLFHLTKDNTNAIQEESQKNDLELPTIASTTGKLPLSVVSKISPVKNPRRPQSKISFENLCQKMLENKKVSFTFNEIFIKL